MAASTSIKFAGAQIPEKGTAVVLTDKKLQLGELAASLDKSAGERFALFARIKSFRGAARKALEMVAPTGVELERILFLGIGESAPSGRFDWLRLGGAAAKLLPSEGEATIILQDPAGNYPSPGEAAAFALGLTLRRYRFDRYKSQKKDDEEKNGPVTVTIGVGDPVKATAAWKIEAAVDAGVELARDLVNEPANILGPVEFADKLAALDGDGLEVEVLEEKALAKLKMNALLGVAVGSERPPRVVIMRWNGGKKGDKPVAFVGKGVVFDTGGISIKPASGMEDMKGDMGGAAAVSGVMLALARRKAKVNAVGIVGIVENMPDGKAQRPGDIVTSMAGKTIEVINTDAEGRLVLADILTHIQKTTSPDAMIDLATLTGAIIVALGHQHAGLFANDDRLADGLLAAGLETGEKVWRLPLGEEYDKMIDSKNADMKNVGGRWGGSITAAQFIKRFVDEGVAWAHLDIAGTAMGSPSSDTNESWGSGFGVRLLDQFVRDRYEKG
ncbi:leucyl aminopeptidase [Afifella sp. IM 167]|uniref:leucyl aminopeptidase n=1 Tax=Afifella sp. IM 167 TaxID=2033586 RepID=UPI001CCD8F82|nr:leucyl aminopeptidase [Afifella sp. IM 167]MBZ8131721.1 leucyl aminopeptidase [Afifella sp. IM 167]